MTVEIISMKGSKEHEILKYKHIASPTSLIFCDKRSVLGENNQYDGTFLYDFFKVQSIVSCQVADIENELLCAMCFGGEDTGLRIIPIDPFLLQQ